MLTAPPIPRSRVEFGEVEGRVEVEKPREGSCFRANIRQVWNDDRDRDRRVVWRDVMGRRRVKRDMVGRMR